MEATHSLAVFLLFLLPKGHNLKDVRTEGEKGVTPVTDKLHELDSDSGVPKIP